VALEVDLGAGDDVFDGLISSSADETRLAAAIFGRSGNDTIRLGVTQSSPENSPVPCYFEADLLFAGGAGNDIMDVRLSPLAEEVLVALAMRGQAGDDTIRAAVNSPTPCFFQADVDIDGGLGRDAIGLVVSALAGQLPNEIPTFDVAVNVTGGREDDTLAVVLNLDAGPGRGSVTARVAGEEGDDRLALFANIGGHLQSSLALNGGTGFDTCAVTKNVTVTGCEA
jgi:hypothetical protein